MFMKLPMQHFANLPGGGFPAVTSNAFTGFQILKTSPADVENKPRCLFSGSILS
jgi:hypothetical protein